MVDASQNARTKDTQRPGGERAAAVPATYTRETDVVLFRDERTGLSMREEFDQLFDHFFRRWSSEWPANPQHCCWRLDVSEAADSVVVRAEAPGFEPSEFDIEVRGYHLILRANHQAESRGPCDEQNESRHCEFHRSILLPAEVERDKVEAEYRHGVLTITLPKKNPCEKGHKIKVRG